MNFIKAISIFAAILLSVPVLAQTAEQRRAILFADELSYEALHCGVVFYALSKNVAHISNEQKQNFIELSNQWIDLAVDLNKNESVIKARIHLFTEDYKRNYMPNGQLYAGWLSVFTANEVKPCGQLWIALPAKLAELQRLIRQ